MYSQMLEQYILNVDFLENIKIVKIYAYVILFFVQILNSIMVQTESKTHLRLKTKIKLKFLIQMEFPRDHVHPYPTTPTRAALLFDRSNPNRLIQSARILNAGSSIAFPPSSSRICIGFPNFKGPENIMSILDIVIIQQPLFQLSFGPIRSKLWPKYVTEEETCQKTTKTNATI